MKRIALLIVVLVFAVAMLPASGQSEEQDGADGTWEPSRPIKLIVPWNAGGGTDILGRALAQHAEQHLGVPVVVENVSGALGGIGAQRVANADPDGYTLLILSQFLVWIDEVRDYPVSMDDFAPIMNLNRDPAAFAVSADSGIETIDDLIEASEEADGGFTVSHSGDGFIWHISGVTFAQELGVDWNFVPFEGTAPGIAAVMGGQIDGVAGGAAEFVSQAEGGNLNVLAVFSEDRFEPLPDVPTAQELGIDLAMYTTRGLVGPAGLPEERIQVLYEGFSKAMQEPEFIETMNDIGLGIADLPADEYTEFLGDVRVMAIDALRSVGMID
ncbi:MAG: tripartite tricarboxylate transporter substrate binding protein [Alkalispirochaeta sp.]